MSQQDLWKLNIIGSSWCSPLQSFQLQTSVQFIEIPIAWHHQNTSRFWVKQYDEMSEGKCKGDVCWKVNQFLQFLIFIIWIELRVEYEKISLLILFIFAIGFGISIYESSSRRWCWVCSKMWFNIITIIVDFALDFSWIYLINQIRNKTYLLLLNWLYWLL